ncbi:MAG TPA: MlaD family protein [Longimicrobium sp.]|jgi:phospholipid/cholesterol/gamma-HCH transport system substrate-binding protein
MSVARSPRREVQVGLFVLAGIFAVLLALFLLTDPGTFRGRYYVSTLVETAGGIRKGDPVQLRGVNIGRIRSFEIEENGVRVRMELEGEYPVPADSKVLLSSNGLLGGVVATIQPGRSRERLDDGDILAPAPPAAGSADIMATAAGLGTRADTVLGRAQALLSQRTIGSVQTSATELQGLLVELSALATEQRSELQGVSSSLRRSAAGVEGAATRPELARAIARTDSISVQLDAATRSLDAASRSLAGIVGRIDRGEGTLGKLSKDESLYNNLNTAAANLNTTAARYGALAEDIQANPRKYVNLRVF